MQNGIPRFNSELRKKAGLTQKELAKAVGVHRATVTKWETEGCAPRVKYFPKIAKALDCKISEIMC